MFDDLNKTMKEAQERWDKIEDCVTSLKESMDGGQSIMPEEVAQLLIHVVDHLRPMNPSQDQLDEVTKGLSDLVGSLGKRR